MKRIFRIRDQVAAIVFPDSDIADAKKYASGKAPLPVRCSSWLARTRKLSMGFSCGL
jgi:hypothetical protein